MISSEVDYTKHERVGLKEGGEGSEPEGHGTVLEIWHTHSQVEALAMIVHNLCILDFALTSILCWNLHLESFSR